MDNLNNLTAKLDMVLAENRDNIREISENTKTITSDTKMFLQKNSANIEQSISNLNKLLVKSDSLVTSLNYLSQETAMGGNNLGKILYNDSLYYDLTHSIKTLKVLSEIILQQIQSDGIKVDASIF